MSLKSIFCQDNAIAVLQKAIVSDRVPHAYIFAGPEGVGKFTTAKAWAKLLLCLDPKVKKNFQDSCGKCESCKLFEGDSHPDFHPIYKELSRFLSDTAKRKDNPKDLTIDVVREFVIEKACTKPGLSRRRVFILDETDKLNASSQNALLKVLEEPPGYCHIILVCPEPEHLLPTIHSRCQSVQFDRIASERIVEHLRGMELSEQQATYLSRFANGQLGRAILYTNLLDSGADLLKIKQNLLKSFFSASFAQALALTENMLKLSKQITDAWADLDAQMSKTDIARRSRKILLQIITTAYHDALRLQIDNTAVLVNEDQKALIAKIAQKMGTEELTESIAETNRKYRWIDSSANEKLIFEHLLLNLFDSDRMPVLT